MTKPAKTVSVYIEAGAKRAFACAVDWIGWARSGKDEQAALDALAGYAERYARVAKSAGIDFSRTPEFEVVERIKGNATTDFGAPGVVPSLDGSDLSAGERWQTGKLLQASWDYLGEVASRAPAELRKGPRGGGRDRDRILDHVLGAESAYARKLGIKTRELRHDEAAEISAFRDSLLAAIVQPKAPVVERGWPQRYVARRTAWHALDHAWEIEDRS